MCGITQDTGGPFLPSVNLRPYFLGGLLKWSQRAQELFATTFTRVWSEQLTDSPLPGPPPPKYGQWEWSWRSSWWIQHLAQNTRNLQQKPELPSGSGRERVSCFEKPAFFFHRADHQHQKTQEAFETQPAAMIKKGCLCCPLGAKGVLGLLLWGESAEQWPKQWSP